MSLIESIIIAIIDGSVVRVVLLFYLSPFWTVLLGKILLDERLSRASVLVFSLAMIGALIMLWDPAIGRPWPQGASDWLALSSGFTFALANVLVRKMQRVSVPVKTVAAWIGAVVIALVWILIKDLDLPAVSSYTCIGAIMLGLFGLTVMTFSTQYGVTHMPVHRSAIILLFEIVVAAVSAGLLANEVIKTGEWLGGILVIAAAVIAALAHLNE